MAVTNSLFYSGVFNFHFKCLFMDLNEDLDTI